MILFTPKIFILLLIQVSFLLNSVQAACDTSCQTCAGNGVSCQACSEGYSLAEGSTSCTVCPAGSYSLAGSSECTSCSAGFFSTEGSSSCSFCQGGYVPSSDQTSCQACLVNQYAPAGSIECIPCPMGDYSLAGSSECISCAPGTYSIEGTLFCTTCPAGKYYSGPSCSNCPGGSIPDSLTTGCESCPAGKYAPSGSSSCLTCSAGSYSREGAEQCSSSCPAGFVQDVSKRACVACGPGSWSRSGDSECFLCPVGTIPDVNQSACEPCGAGLWSSPGDSECSLCPAGTVLNLDQDACVSCGAGLWSNAGDSECSSCPAGSLPNASQGGCVSCGAGCGPNCNACESSTTCAECTYPTENKNGICVFICSQGQFATSSGCIGNCFVCEGTPNCTGCSANCQECQSKSECTVCKPGDIRQLDPVTFSSTCSPKPKNPEKDATKSTAVSLGATSTVAKSISSGSSGALGFGVVAKVIRNVRYFSIAYSNKTQEVFAAEESSSFELNAPESLDNIDSKELNGNFAKYDVEPNFLINYWGNLIPILILCGCFVILKILKRYLGQSQKRKILTHKVIIMFQVTAGNYLVNSLYGSFDEIVLYFILEVQTCKFDSALSWISFLCGFAFLIVGLGFFVFHFEILKKYQAAKSQKDVENSDEKRLKNFKAQHAYVKVLFEDFKDDSLAQQSFLASFMIRASLLNVLLCLFVKYPLMEAILYLGVNLMFALFLVIKRPYEKLKGAAAQYFCEAIILITYSCALILTLMDHNGADAESLRRILEKIIVVLGIALNVGGTVFQCLDIFIGVCVYVKSFKIWRARLKVAKAPVGLVSKAAGNPDLTFMKVKSGLKIDPTPEDGGLASLSGSPTRLISRNLDTEIERLSSPFTNSTRRPSTIIFTGESQDDLDYYKRTKVFEIARESETTRMEEISRRSGLNSSSIRRRTSTIVFTGESQNDLDYHKRTSVFEIARESETRNYKNISSYSIRKTNSTIIFTGESQNDPDYHKRTGVFEIVAESMTKREERDGRKRIISTSGQMEKEGEAFGDLMVFDYEKAQKANKAKETE